jgi:hypothetical protein
MFIQWPSNAGSNRPSKAYGGGQESGPGKFPGLYYREWIVSVRPADRQLDIRMIRSEQMGICRDVFSSEASEVFFDVRRETIPAVLVELKETPL